MACRGVITLLRTRTETMRRGSLQLPFQVTSRPHSVAAHGIRFDGAASVAASQQKEALTSALDARDTTRILAAFDDMLLARRSHTVATGVEVVVQAPSAATHPMARCAT